MKALLLLPNGTAEKVARLFAHDGTWRLIDAYIPRVFGLLFQAFLIAQYGADHYALLGWVLGAFGLVLAIFPDPHSYILVRANGLRARLLYALTVPALLLKVLVAGGIVITWLATTPSGQVASPHAQDWKVVVLAVLFYGSTEFLWAVLGTVSLATGRIRRTAKIGMLMRAVAICLLFVSWSLGGVNIALYLLLASLPVFGGWVMLSPISLQWRRVCSFFFASLKRYTGWLQGVALITAALFQLPTIVLGSWPGVDPALVGVVAFTNRVLMAGFQPFQILQSVVIRDTSMAKSLGTSIERTSLWIVFKAGALGFAFLSLLGIMMAWSINKVGQDALTLLITLSLGLATSIWYRHELAVALAVSSVRQIFLTGYVPVFLMILLASPVMMKLLGVNGLGLVFLSGWIALSNSWRWTR